MSVTMHDDLVYVANFGGTYHTAGFRLQPCGELRPIPNSRQPLSGLDTEPSTIAFSPDGSKLVLSERQTSKIDVFTVNADGSISNPAFNVSAGPEPFGLQFTPAAVLLVTSTAGSVTSYAINADNTLGIISANAASLGAATCWVATDGVHAWVTNTASSNVSAYSVGTNGTLNPFGIVAMQPATGPDIFPPIVPPTSFPIDLALSADSRYLYVVYSELGRIFAYRTDANGQLRVVDSVSPYQPETGVEGLAAY